MPVARQCLPVESWQKQNDAHSWMQCSILVLWHVVTGPRIASTWALLTLVGGLSFCCWTIQAGACSNELVAWLSVSRSCACHQPRCSSMCNGNILVLAARLVSRSVLCTSASPLEGRAPGTVVCRGLAQLLCPYLNRSRAVFTTHQKAAEFDGLCVRWTYTSLVFGLSLHVQDLRHPLVTSRPLG